MWYVDTNGDQVPDEWLAYGLTGDIPLVANTNREGICDIAAIRVCLWHVDTDGDIIADQWSYYGLTWDTFLGGSIG